MSLKVELISALKDAMKSKDKVVIETLRSIKAEIIKLETSPKFLRELREDEEIKLLQKMQKQRNDAASIYIKQGRRDLAENEINQKKVLASFLPKQMTLVELEKAITEIIKKMGISNYYEVGKVIGIASKELAGRTTGSDIARIVKDILKN